MCNSALPFPLPSFFLTSVRARVTSSPSTLWYVPVALFLHLLLAQLLALWFLMLCANCEKKHPLKPRASHSQQFPKPCLRLLWPLCLPQAAAVAESWSEGSPTALLPSSWVSQVSIVPRAQLPVPGSPQLPLLTNPRPWNTWDSCASIGLCSAPLQRLSQARHHLSGCCAKGKAGLAETSDVFLNFPPLFTSFLNYPCSVVVTVTE